MAPKADRLAITFGMVAKLFANKTTKLGLATTIAALWLTAVPMPEAVAEGGPNPISGGGAGGPPECNRLAQRYPLEEWGNTQIHLYRTCMARHGQQELLAKRGRQ